MKKYYFITFLCLISVVFLLIPRNDRQKEIDIDYEMLEEEQTTIIYYIFNDELIGIPVAFQSKNRYELVEEVFRFLTENANAIRQSCYSCVNLSTTLLSYELANKSILLNVSKDFLRMESEKVSYALAQLLYSYQELGYDEVLLAVEGVKLTQIGDYLLENGIQNNIAVNISVLSTSAITKTIRIYYDYQNGAKSFINYVVNQDVDELKFTVEKIISFINKEYACDLQLISIEKNKDCLFVTISGEQKNFSVLEKMLEKNLSIDVEIGQ